MVTQHCKTTGPARSDTGQKEMQCLVVENAPDRSWLLNSESPLKTILYRRQSVN